MSDYRVVCDNPEHSGGVEADTLADALDYVRRGGGKADCSNLRVQERVSEWVDVPEPLPALPGEVWLVFEPDGFPGPWLTNRQSDARDWKHTFGGRVFRGTVGDWTEVTDA